LLTGGEGRSLAAWDLRSCSAVVEVKDAHATRIRCVALPWAADDSPQHLCATAGSDGAVKLWDMRATAQPLSTLQTRARITCLLPLPPLPDRSAAVSRPRVAVDAAAPVSGGEGAKKEEGAWWESGEKGAKMSALFAARQEQRAASERWMRGIGPKALKALKEQEVKGAADKKAFGADNKALEGRDGGRGGGRGEGEGRGRKRPRDRQPAAGGGGQFAKAGQRLRDGDGGSGGRGGRGGRGGGRITGGGRGKGRN
jgi:uncharacterized membrane protein YgcG